MSINKLEYTKNKIRNGRFYLYQQNKINKLKEKLNPKDEELEELEDDLFNELMYELKAIKKKRTLEAFIKENKELINELELGQKTELLKYIKNKFY